MVTVLCAARTSVWHLFRGLDVYDEARDARTWPGGTRVIAHPPCRGWSRACAHQAIVPPGERDLGLWCLEQVRRWGGVLEQPAGSRLLWPCPAGGSLMYCEQGWFGFPTTKPTWLWWSGVALPRQPLSLMNGSGHRGWQQLSAPTRSATPVRFAAWLLMEVTR